ncbi:MAG: hypothetical protein QG604_49 [Candidatus Dependentiae bacterium]|nr:hypothetical protein [Candidatus Dependentiae bacterium]
MTKRHRYQVNKLVRDRTPERLEIKNIANKVRVMELAEYIVELKKKLVEESQEVIDTTSHEECISELADVLEVIHAMTRALDSSFDIVENKRQEKLVARGSFDKRLYAEWDEMDEENSYYTYYRELPTKYPEIEIPKE